MLLQFTVQMKGSRMDVQPMNDETADWLQQNEGAWQETVDPVIARLAAESYAPNEAPRWHAGSLLAVLEKRWPEHTIDVRLLRSELA